MIKPDSFISFGWYIALSTREAPFILTVNQVKSLQANGFIGRIIQLYPTSIAIRIITEKVEICHLYLIDKQGKGIFPLCRKKDWEKE